MMSTWIILAIAGFCAGVVNVVAGGGGFLTYPALLLTGIDPRAANITSTVGLYPMQVTAGYVGRAHAASAPNLSFKTMLAISFTGGILGAILLLCTSPSFFGKLVPYLVLFATAMFALGSFRKPAPGKPGHRMGKKTSILIHSLTSIYMGYYGGGGGFMVLAALTMAGMPVRKANASKIILICAMNTAATLIFLFSKDIFWQQVLVIFLASEIGSHTLGIYLLNRVSDRIMRIGIVVYGLGLAVWLFARA